jgi:hypothetical protein
VELRLIDRAKVNVHLGRGRVSTFFVLEAITPQPPGDPRSCAAGRWWATHGPPRARASRGTAATEPLGADQPRSGADR